MRVRLPFAGIFFLLLLIVGYAGLSSLQLDAFLNDKVLHFLTFFLLTLVFYWILDTNRRRTLNLTVVVCTGILGVGSEFIQAVLPNGRTFDVFDIAANVVGSIAALGLCSWYHLRMLERRRARRQYNAVPGEEEMDIELGEGHETGVVSLAGDAEDTTTAAPLAAPVPKPRTLEEEVDNWDENAVDTWEEGDGDGDIGNGNSNGSKPNTGEVGDEPKKRSD